MTDDELLLPRFVGTYEKLDDPTVWETDPISQQLAVGAPDGYGFDKWRPFQVNAASSLLEPLYAKLPARFPKLFEFLILSYRWAEVDLMTYRLPAHSPGPDLAGLLEQMSKDPAIWGAPLPAGYI